MSFEEWIDDIEENGTRVRGLKHCSLEHRTALREAFNAGARCEDTGGDALDFMEGR